MENLYSRLSQENIAKLEKMSEKYPTIFRLIKKELEEKTSYLDLTVGIAFDLAQELNDTNNGDITVSFLHDTFSKDPIPPIG